MTRRSAVILGVLVAGVAVWAIARRLAAPALSDEQQIEKLFKDAIQAAEDKRVGDAVAGLSERFRGDGLDKQEVKQLIAAHVFRGDWVSVTLAGQKIEVHGNGAEAVVDLVMARSGQGGLSGLLPTDATANRITCRLEREEEGCAWSRRSAGRSIRRSSWSRRSLRGDPFPPARLLPGGHPLARRCRFSIRSMLERLAAAPGEGEC